MNTSIANTTTTLPDRVSFVITVNSTLPPEQYRFIPGSTPVPTNQNKSVPAIREPPFNGTGYYIEDEAETGLNDIQTLFLACFATLIPLVIILVTGFTIRILWRRYKRKPDCSDYDGVIHRESTSEPTDRPLHSHLLNGEKIGDTHLNSSDDICDGPLNNGLKSGNSHSTTNGSIITMTMRNNHLIVETEERNDIEEDSRETTLKYSPSGSGDGVFVVEVQQGVRRSPSTTTAPPSINRISHHAEPILNDQRALIHSPPGRFSEEDNLPEGDADLYAETTSRTSTPSEVRCKTGLSQSNQSLSHSSYTYGSQQGYDAGYYGYPNYCGYVNDEPPQRLEDKNKPKITSAVYKNRCNSKGSLDLPMDGPLYSDLGFSRRDDFDAIQEEQSRLGNIPKDGDSVG